MISVCMASYNGEKYIKEQIDSILCQLGKDDELIISDDGSKDNTIEIINNYKDFRIKLLKHKSNQEYSNHEKASANFANALENAKGDYIFLTDQDDIWMKNKIKLCMEKLKTADFVYHNAEYFYEDGRKNYIRFNENPIPSKWYKNLVKMSLSGCCFAFNRKCLDLCLPFPDKLIGQDYWISTIAIKCCSVAYISDCLIKHRRFSTSVSYNKHNSLLFKLKYRFDILNDLNKRFRIISKMNRK